MMESFSSEFGCLCFHKTSLRGKCHDFKLLFNESQDNVEMIIDPTSDLFRQLINSYNNQRMKARLIAVVNFAHVNNEQHTITERRYHFTSYAAEEVDDIDDFVTRHLCKIASRMDSFNRNGSNLLIKNIENIYISISLM